MFICPLRTIITHNIVPVFDKGVGSVVLVQECLMLLNVGTILNGD